MQNFKTRKNLRLKDYDYSMSGFYFVTICINQRICLLSEIIDNKVVLSDVGMMVERNYLGLEKRFTNIRCDRYVIMPNHVHCIFEIKNCDAAVGVVPCANPISRQPQGIAATNKTSDQKNASLADVIGVFKSISTVEYIRNVSKNNWQKFDKKLWQRNYHEHIIRNEESYYKICEYIEQNPVKWGIDKLNPLNTSD